MSYILEALKKAEQERELGRVPGIDSAHDPASPSVSRRWIWVAFGVICINAVLVLSVFWPEKEQGSAAVSPPYTEPQLQTAPQRQAVAPPPARVEPVIAPAQPPVRPPQEAIQAPQVRVDTARPPPEPPAQQAQVAPVTPVVQTVAATPAPAVEPELPVWPQVPGNLFQQIHSGLRLDVHVYGDQPSTRFVLINLQKYYEGEELQEGPTLDEITPEGVILSFQGQRFRVRAQ